MWILDVEKALRDGCDVPRGGVFRGEEAEILNAVPNGPVQIKLPNSLAPDKVYLVDSSHLIHVADK